MSLQARPGCDPACWIAVCDHCGLEFKDPWSEYCVGDSMHCQDKAIMRKLTSHWAYYGDLCFCPSCKNLPQIVLLAAMYLEKKKGHK